jgi:hypothetical protein
LMTGDWSRSQYGNQGNSSLVRHTAIGTQVGFSAYRDWSQGFTISKWLGLHTLRGNFGHRCSRVWKKPGFRAIVDIKLSEGEQLQGITNPTCVDVPEEYGTLLVGMLGTN